MALTDMMPFISGGTSGMSIEELRRRQAVAAAVASQRRAYPKTFGEGIAALGEGIGERMENDRLRAAEERIAAQRMPAVPADTAAPAARPLPGRRVPTTSVAPDAAPAGVVPGAAPVGPPAGSFSEASPEALDRITNALMTSPQEVAQVDPTPGALKGALGSQSDDVSQYRPAIGGIESSNDYSAVGVPTKYGRAMGRYGVIEANIPKWTAEALGQSLTPQQFLANDKAQDAVFDHKFGQYVAKYGPEKAARAWYGGEGNINNLNATDVHEKLSVHDYGRDFMNRLRGRRSDTEGDTSAAPVQLASLGGTSGTMSDAPPIGMGGSAAQQRPDLEQPNPDQPTVVDSIRPMSVRPEMMAQIGPEMFSPRPMMSDASAALPAARPPVAAPVAAARPPGATLAGGAEIGPAPTPLPFPSRGLEPRREGPTREMLHYQGVATNPGYREDIRADAANRFKILQTQQESDYVRKWTDWRTDEDKRREYELGDPARRQTLTRGHLENIKLRQDLEGEGFKELTPEAAARLYPGSSVPEGQAIWLNRKGEPKFGPAAPKTTVNVDQKGELEESKVSGKIAAEQQGAMREAANKATGTLFTLNRAETLLKQIDTGALEPAKLKIGAFARGLGVSDETLAKMNLHPEMIGSKQAFNAIVGELMIGKIGTGGFPANNFSNPDREFLLSTIASLGDDPESNRIKLGAMKLVAQRDLEKATEWALYRRNPENKGKGFYDFQDDWLAKIERSSVTGELQRQAEEVLVRQRLANPAAREAPRVLPTDERDRAMKFITDNPTHPDAPILKRMLGIP